MFNVTYYQPKKIWSAIGLAALIVMASVAQGWHSTGSDQQAVSIHSASGPMSAVAISVSRTN